MEAFTNEIVTTVYYCSLILVFLKWVTHTHNYSFGSKKTHFPKLPSLFTRESFFIYDITQPKREESLWKQQLKEYSKLKYRDDTQLKNPQNVQTWYCIHIINITLILIGLVVNSLLNQMVSYKKKIKNGVWRSSVSNCTFPVLKQRRDGTCQALCHSDLPVVHINHALVRCVLHVFMTQINRGWFPLRAGVGKATGT